MALATANLVGLTGTQLQEVMGRFRFPHQIERLILLLQNGPVGIVFGIVNLMDHSLTRLQHIAVVIILNTRYCITSHLVILKLTMPFTRWV
jgi:hypothetical protein